MPPSQVTTESNNYTTMNHRKYVIHVPALGYYVKDTQSWTQNISEASIYSEETFAKYHDHTGSVDARWVLVS